MDEFEQHGDKEEDGEFSELEDIAEEVETGFRDVADALESIDNSLGTLNIVLWVLAFAIALGVLAR